ncbi:MAG: LVIVD repeat-containing protein [Candidatus Zixiibacteriota bacterium]
MKYISIIALISAILFFGCGEQTLPTANDDDGSSRKISLYYPDPGTVVNDFRIYFDWGGREESNGYKIRVFKDGETIIDHVEYTSSFKTLEPVYQGEYSWTVGMRDTSGEWGNWSDTISFTLIQEPLALYATLQMPGQSEDVVRNDDIIYIADNHAGVSVVDYSSGTMEYHGSYEIPTQDRTLALWVDAVNENLWAAAYRSNPPVGLFELDDPLNPSYYTLSVWARRASDIEGFYRGDNVYIAVSDQDDGIYVFDVTNPSIVDGELFRISGNTYGVDVFDSLFFAMAGEIGVIIGDLSDPYDLDEISSIDTYGDARECAVDSAAQIAYIADGIAGLTLIDFANPESPEIITNIDTQVGDAQDVHIHGDRLYLCIGSKGVLVYDISNPRAPESIQHIETMYANGIFVDGDYLYIADRDWGIILVGEN